MHFVLTYMRYHDTDSDLGAEKADEEMEVPALKMAHRTAYFEAQPLSRRFALLDLTSQQLRCHLQDVFGAIAEVHHVFLPAARALQSMEFERQFKELAVCLGDVLAAWACSKN